MPPLWSRKTLQSLLVPGGALLLAVTLLDSFGWMSLTPPALNFLYYCGLIGGMFLAWRFRSSRIFIALVVIFLSDQAIAFFGGAQHPVPASGITAVHAMAILVPLNYVLISLIEERGFSTSSAGPVALFLFVEFVFVAVLCRSADSYSPLASHARHPAAPTLLPGYSIFVFLAAGIFLLVRFLLSRKPVDGALLWSLAAFFLALRSTGNARLSTLFAATSIVVLAVAIIENSYLLAYHDELTALPSRRAFNDALLGLTQPYSIAVVDIDHFKNFNDTYGHDIGDQVLRLVASNLSRVTGGGQAYRCGGEEFNILFPGKTTAEVVDHLERLRITIEKAEFRTRTADRRQTPRGPDRRNERPSARPRKKGHAIRELTQPETSASLSVTVSIGVATAEAEKSDPEMVLQAADKALYRAKGNGRNRVETAPAKRRARIKAAVIA